MNTKRSARLFMGMFALVLFALIQPAALNYAYADSNNLTAGTIADVEQVISRTIGFTERTIPEAVDFHEAFGVHYGYPVYNENFDRKLAALDGEIDVEAEKAAVREENEALLDYTSIDKDGNLYKNGVRKTPTDDGKTITQLVRHTTGVKNYGSAIPDNAVATTKQLSMRLVRYGNVVTGLYAPPGEVVKITIKSSTSSKPVQDLGLKVLIGNYGGNAEQVIIPATREYMRMPMMNATLALDGEGGVNYVGSPFGGAILIYSNGLGGTTLDIEIEGAVEMPTYFFGYTSDEELQRQLTETPGPYFAFSTPRGLRAVGPTTLLKGKTVEEIKRVMDFWDKAIGLSFQFEAGSFDSTNPNNNYMVEMFEPYIPAGSAVNMGNYCICPVNWGESFLSADGLIKSGAWGPIHEINHSFPWGGAVDGMTEISNNVINALTYQLYTNIAANRSEPTQQNNPSSGGLDSWNWVSDLYTTVERLRVNVGPDYIYPVYNLQVYVPLQHMWGADTFLEAVHLYHENGGKYNRKLSGNVLYTNSNVWMYAASLATGYNMGYYMRDVQGFPEYATEDTEKSDYITTDVREQLTGPLYIPSGCLYASGVVYNPVADGASAALCSVVEGLGVQAADAFVEGKDVVELGRSFRIPYGEMKRLNFHRSVDGGYVSVAKDETVELVGYTQPLHGTLQPTDDAFILNYIPSDSVLEDSFYITFKLTVTQGPYTGETQNVTFTISLLQETSGFTATSYAWTNPSGVSDDKIVEYAVANGVFDNGPVTTASTSVAGFNSSAAYTLTVAEGKVYLHQTGAVDLRVRGRNMFNACVGASPESIPSVSDAQVKRRMRTWSNDSAYDTTTDSVLIRAYVIPEGESAPEDTSSYGVVIHEGDPLYVRAYVYSNNETGRFRIGYADTEGVMREFADGDVFKMTASEENLTPSITSYVTEKLYSYKSPAEQTTEIDGELNIVGEPLTVVRTWDLTKNTQLAYRDYAEKLSKNPSSMVDDIDTKDPAWNLRTQYHTYISNDGPYAAEFVFELNEESTFNMVRFMGHNNMASLGTQAGKIKDYEIYVAGEGQYEALLAADVDSPMLVAKGTLGTANNYGDFNRINFDRTATGKYVRVVARSQYPRGSQYYYAITDFRVCMMESISGEGTLTTAYDRNGPWRVDDAFVNKRADLMTTEIGSGIFEFHGTGVIMYAATGPDYGTMIVELDGLGEGGPQPIEVNLNSDRLLGQQAVFWKSGLDPEADHQLVFYPKEVGTDRINVECFEVKDASALGNPSVNNQVNLELSIDLDEKRFAYTGEDIEPSVAIWFAHQEVTPACLIQYESNREVGTATVRALLERNDELYTAEETFEIMKGVYPGTITASFAEDSAEYRYQADGEGAVLTPCVQGAPESSTVTYYYGSTPPVESGSSTAGEGLYDGSSNLVWSPASITSASIDPGSYYLWAVVSTKNYRDYITEAVEFTVLPGPHVHEWGEWQEAKAATCTEAGVEQRFCTLDPSHVESREIEALGHDWGDWEIVTPATCTSAGIEQRVCKHNASHVESRDIESFGHDWAEWKVTTPATCTSAGVETRTCKHDATHVETREAEALGHEWGEWQVTKAATCVEDGEEQCVCAHDSTHVETRTIEKIGHSWGEWVVVTPATCEQDGLEKRVCAHNPLHFETRVIESSGHSWGAWQVSKEPTATEDGLEWRECAHDPSHVETREIEKLVYDWGPWQEITAATCTTDGLEQRIDNNDPTHIETRAIERLYHDWGEWTVKTAATCTENGVEQRVCKHDSQHVETREIEALGHEWSEWQVVTPATCSAPGVEKRACKHDSTHFETREINQLAHSWGEWTVATPATCTTPGIEQRICAHDSSEIETRIIEPLGHHWGDWTVVKQATCTEDGIEERVCEHDSERGHVETRTTEKLNHKWSEWAPTKLPTYTEVGTEQRTCLNDATHIETREIDKLVPTKEVEYEIISNPDGSWKQGEESNYSFSSNAEFAKFVCVLVDGVELSSDSYIVRPGSTVVELKTSFLDTLSTGLHVAIIRSSDGEASTTFSIVQSSEGGDEPDSGKTDPEQGGANPDSGKTDSDQPSESDTPEKETPKPDTGADNPSGNEGSSKTQTDTEKPNNPANNESSTVVKPTNSTTNASNNAAVKASSSTPVTGDYLMPIVFVVIGVAVVALVVAILARRRKG